MREVVKRTRLPVFLTVDEFSKLIRNTKKNSDKIAFLLGFGSGLRVSEIKNLEQRDINFKEKNILIRLGKGGKDRIVPLPKGFRESHLQHIPIKVGVRQLQKAFRRASEKAGLLKDKPDLHFHSLRHGFATRCLGSGMKIHYLQHLLGHTNISTTSRYLHANPKDALKEYEDLF